MNFLKNILLFLLHQLSLTRVKRPFYTSRVKSRIVCVLMAWTQWHESNYSLHEADRQSSDFL